MISSLRTANGSESVCGVISISVHCVSIIPVNNLESNIQQPNYLIYSSRDLFIPSSVSTTSLDRGDMNCILLSQFSKFAGSRFAGGCFFLFEMWKSDVASSILLFLSTIVRLRMQSRIIESFLSRIHNKSWSNMTKSGLKREWSHPRRNRNLRSVCVDKTRISRAKSV